MDFERALELTLGLMAILILMIGLILKLSLCGFLLYISYVFIIEPVVDFIKEYIRKNKGDDK